MAINDEEWRSGPRLTDVADGLLARLRQAAQLRLN